MFVFQWVGVFLFIWLVDFSFGFLGFFFVVVFVLFWDFLFVFFIFLFFEKDFCSYLKIPFNLTRVNNVDIGYIQTLP